MPTDTPCVTTATDDSICELIGRASRRLVVLAPALHEKVAQVLATRWVELGADRISVILDVDAEVFRLGYGDLSSLQLLEKTASQLGTMIQRQPGVRIGVIVSDDATLIYSPTPLLIEAGPVKNDPGHSVSPNAIYLDQTPRAFATEVGHGEEGVRGQTIGLDKAKTADIAKVEESLRDNPPQPFDVSRKVRVFNAAFEFVDFKLSGTSINHMTAPIPKHLYGIADEQTRSQIQSSCSLVPAGHKLSGKHLRRDKDLIIKKYLRSVHPFGTVVLRSQKAAFEEEVQELREAVNKFGENAIKDLQAAMDKTRENLAKSLLPQVRRRPPEKWLKSGQKKLDTETLRTFLDQDLRQAFGSADRLINNMKVSVVFKGVTYELLQSEEFLQVAKDSIPELEQLYEEFDAAKASENQAKTQTTSHSP